MNNLRNSIQNLIENYKYEIAILFFTFFSLSTIINCNFISDDGIYYFLRGNIILQDNNDNIFNIATDNIFSWIKRGRFFPLSAYSLFVMYLFRSNILYKTIIIIAVCINIAMFGVFVEKLTSSKRIKLLLMLFINLFFQIVTVYHNSILSFSMFMQIMFAILMLILIYLINYLQTNKKIYLYVSICFFAIGLLTYEIGFAFIGIVLLLILFYKRNVLKSLKLNICYGIPLVVVGIINLIIKVINNVNYEGVSVTFSPLRILITMAKQYYATFPLSNYVTSYNNGILSNNLISFISNVRTVDVLLALFFVIILFNIIKNTKKDKINIDNFYFLLFSLAFIICPGALSSLTEKYQSELTFGIAHISVYIQYFGLLLLYLWIYTFLKNKINGKIKYRLIYTICKVISVFTVIIILLINQQTTRLYINNANLYWKYPKESVQKALKQNILSSINENDKLTVITQYAWDSSEFYSEFSNKKINYISLQNVLDSEISKITNPKGIIELFPLNTYILRYYGSEEEQDVYLGKLDTIIYDSDTNDIKNINVNDVKIFTNNINNGYVLYQSIDKDANLNYDIRNLEELVKQDGTNMIYQLNKFTNLIDFNTITFIKNYITPQEDINIQYMDGVSILETYENERWRWCEKTAKVNIINNTNKDINVQITLKVSNLMQQMNTLNLMINDINKTVDYNYLGESLKFNIVLKSGNNLLELNTDAPRVDAPNDSRNMYFKLNNLSIDKLE